MRGKLHENLTNEYFVYITLVDVRWKLKSDDFLLREIALILCKVNYINLCRNLTPYQAYLTANDYKFHYSFLAFLCCV